MRTGLLNCNNHHQAGKTAVCSSVCPIQGSHISEKIRIPGKTWLNKPPCANAYGPIFACCAKALQPNPDLFIIRSFWHNKNWHKIKEKRRWRQRRWWRRRWRIFGGKPGQSSTDLLCWSYNSSTGRSCLYDPLLHEKVKRYFSSSPKSSKSAILCQKDMTHLLHRAIICLTIWHTSFPQCIPNTLSFLISTFCNSGPKERDKHREGPQAKAKVRNCINELMMREQISNCRKILLRLCFSHNKCI